MATAGTQLEKWCSRCICSSESCTSRICPSGWHDGRSCRCCTCPAWTNGSVRAHGTGKHLLEWLPRLQSCAGWLPCMASAVTCNAAKKLHSVICNQKLRWSPACCYSCNILWTCRWIAVQTEFTSSIERCLQATAAPQYGISSGVQLPNEFLERLVDCQPLAIVDSIASLLYPAALCCCVSVMFL